MELRTPTSVGKGEIVEVEVDLRPDEQPQAAVPEALITQTVSPKSATPASAAEAPQANAATRHSVATPAAQARPTRHFVPQRVSDTGAHSAPLPSTSPTVVAPVDAPYPQTQTVAAHQGPNSESDLGEGPSSSGAFGRLGAHSASVAGLSGAQPVVSKAKLISAGAACQGIFPETNTGTSKLTLVLAVKTDGTASPTSVKTSSGSSKAALERAARACAERLRFAPARGADGEFVASSSIVSLTIGKRNEIASRTRRVGTI